MVIESFTQRLSDLFPSMSIPVEPSQNETQPLWKHRKVAEAAPKLGKRKYLLAMHKESKVIMKGGAINAQNELGEKRPKDLRKGICWLFLFLY